MTIHEPAYAAEEHARRGREMYEQQICSQVEGDNHGRVVAIDIDTGEYEIADSTLTASRQLLARAPVAQIWCVRVGYPAVHRFGSLPRDDHGEGAGVRR